MMDCNANWIWDSGPEKPVNHYVYMRKTFDVPAKPMEVIVRVCADSRYKLYVNGKLVGRGPVRSDPRWQYYDTHDLTRHIRRGKNVIAALVHHYGTGTFTYILGRGGFLLDGTITCIDPMGGRGSSRGVWSAVSDHRSDPAKAKAPQTSLSHSIVSDESWKVRPSDAWFRDLPRMSIQLEFPEVYDANRAPDGWTEVGFDDSLWQRATVIGPAGMEPWPNLIAREIPFMYEREIFPVAVQDVGIADVTGIDLPENNKIPVAAIMGRENKKATTEPEKLLSNTGSLCLRPTVEDIFQVQPMNPRGPKESSARRSWRAANKGKEVCTVYPLSVEERAAEKAVYLVLDFGREVTGHPRIRVSTEGTGMIDLGYGELLTNGKVDPFRASVHYADRYIVKPGTQEWETFDKRAFRYMQIDFREFTAPLTLESVSVNFSTYPVQWRGTFECSDDRLNEIWRIGAYTVQLNMEDAYTDCPWRERTQWWGDARIEALSNYYAFGDPWLVRQGIKQIGQSQRDDGATICFWPGTYDNIIPAFSLYWIMSIWDYYVFTGDKVLVREMYPQVTNLIDWFEGFKDERGLLTDVGHWMFIEWTNTDLRGTVTALNCLYYHALMNASRMATLVRDAEARRGYRDRAEEVKAAINAHLYDVEKGIYPEYWSDEENSFSPKISQMANGLAAAYGVAPARVRESVLRYTLDPTRDVVPAGSFYAYYYLLALFGNGMTQEALDYIRMNWGKMLDWGATTFWEHWHNQSSLCHGWASAPTYHLPAWVLGVQPAEPGFRRISVAPNPGDLAWARGIVPTPMGGIGVEWRKSDAKFDLVLSIPEGSKADVALPLPPECEKPVVLVNGKAKLPRGVLGKRLSAGRAMFTVTQPGEYRFSVKATSAARG